MQEILTGITMAFDVVAIYIVMANVKAKFTLALWTSFCHMLFPFFGFYFGEWIAQFLLGWANILSAILLFCLGIQLLISSKNANFPVISLPILAVFVSLDTFSVSLSFGMLHLQRNLFIISAGITTFFLSYAALLLSHKLAFLNGVLLNWLAGITLIIISILSLL
ncbi:MAG: manganese efflux pump [Solibacillus sp.]